MIASQLSGSFSILLQKKSSGMEINKFIKLILKRNAVIKDFSNVVRQRTEEMESCWSKISKIERMWNNLPLE